MIASLLAALLLSVPASAQVRACQTNEMTAAWKNVAFGLWLSDYTVPDDASRVATLRYKGCMADAEGMESRAYTSEDGSLTVIARTSAGGDDGATSLILTRGGAQAELGTWGHHKVFYKGVGIDQVSVLYGGSSTRVKNVFVIPVYDAVK
ncbi:MAG: hypothetical protein COV48_10440 [Elusimicrobia bacterium CG11_big_fil_rev_8_21_14_0_20_64_6]|nr:MAG: hypothetical protein COV48_10440 [Elusimicrobia bacterium CG11_big_fil_rev_8_21_14_0_20_64_6]